MRSTRAPSRRLRTIVTVVVAIGLSGCVTDAYVEPTQPVIAANQLPTVQDPKPVTVLFEWLTNGKENPGAAAQMKGRVLSAVTESGMFSRVSPTVDSSQANILTISIDDRADIGKSEAKGFGTGLTLGLVGSLARDDYVCKADYTSAGKTMSASARDTLLTAVGAHATPTGLKPVKPLDGINEIVDQLVWHSLKRLDGQGAFAGVSR